MASPATLNAVVKSVLSADTLVLRGNVVGGAIPKERVIHFDGLTAARIGNRDRADEPFAFEAREYLRSLVIGKNVKFGISYTVPSSSGAPLEFGVVYGGQNGDLDLGLETVRAGWAKVRESKGPAGGADEEEGGRKAALRAAEEEAKSKGLGVWGAPVERTVNFSMPDDPNAFLAQHKAKPIDAIIEATPNGSTLRARLLLSDSEHQFIQLGIAGVRAPRASSANTSEGEEWGDQSRYFVESRLLQRLIKITLLSLPTPAAAPSAFGSTADAAPPPPASLFLGTITHPAGNIAALLLSVGLAKIVDWHAGFLSQSPTPTMMSELRKAEAEAKAGRKALWASLPAPAPQEAAVRAQREKDSKFDAAITRVWGPDLLSVVKVGDSTERRVQLASTRAPRASDTKLAGLSALGRETLRKKLIGKQVKVQVDYIKPAEGDYEQRECVTIRTNAGGNVAVNMVSLGFLGVLRHKQGDDQRSSTYDELLEAEAKAIADAKGIHSGKEFPLPRIIDASESAQKAAPFLNSFKRAGRTQAMVDFVAAGSRFKIFVPKQDVKLTLVLAGIRAPRTARNANEKSEPFGQEAATYASRKALQRDCEFSVEATDKVGGFVGRLFLNGVDFAVELVKEGLAKLDDYATPTKELEAAQEAAKQAKKGIWSSYDAAAEAAAAAPVGPVAARREYIDVVLSDIRGNGADEPFSFAVQQLQNGGIPELESLVEQLNLESDAATAGFIPRMGDIVAAKSEYGQWYRGRIRRSNPSTKTSEIFFVDYGNTEIVPFAKLRPLGAQFKNLPHQAKEAVLSHVKLLGAETEYGRDSVDRFRDLTEGRQLVANVDAREANLLHLTLFDPKDPASLTGGGGSINVALVRDGLARIDQRSRFRQAYPEVVNALDEAQKEAKRSRAGAYELGDIFEDD